MGHWNFEQSESDRPQHNEEPTPSAASASAKASQDVPKENRYEGPAPLEAQQAEQKHSKPSRSTASRAEGRTRLKPGRLEGWRSRETSKLVNFCQMSQSRSGVHFSVPHTTRIVNGRTGNWAHSQRLWHKQ
jgi:hypothetical protein